MKSFFSSTVQCLAQTKRWFMQLETLAWLAPTIGITVLAAAMLPILALVMQSSVPAKKQLVIHPVAVEASAASSDPQPPYMMTANAEVASAAPEAITYTVTTGDTLEAIGRRYCVDYHVVARQNDIADPNWIYAGKTVLRFKNGCAQAPQVLVKQSVSPRELVRNDKASSGKRIPSLAPRDTEARSLPAAAPLSQASAHQSPPVAAIAVADSSAALSEVHHREIYRIVALRKIEERSKAQNAELARLTAHIRDAVLSRYQLPNPDCLYTKDTGKRWNEQVLTRIHCIRENYGPVIDEVAAAHKLPAAYLEAVIFVESGGRPDAISPTGCTGLKQFTLRSAKLFGLPDRLDPFESIRAGGRHLESNLRQWRGDVAKATAHYNAGLVMVGTSGFNAANFPYTQSVLRVQSLIEKELPRFGHDRNPISALTR